MSKSLFIKDISNNILFSLLNKTCKQEDNKYIWNKVSFKTALYHNYISEFCNEIKAYYHPKKQFYIERKIDYYKFITIIRQICNVNKINYTSKFEYGKSNYEIVYYIFIPDDATTANAANIN